MGSPSTSFGWWVASACNGIHHSQPSGPQCRPYSPSLYAGCVRRFSVIYEGKLMQTATTRSVAAHTHTQRSRHTIDMFDDSEMYRIFIQTRHFDRNYSFCSRSNALIFRNVKQADERTVIGEWARCREVREGVY